MEIMEVRETGKGDLHGALRGHVEALVLELVDLLAHLLPLLLMALDDGTARLLLWSLG